MIDKMNERRWKNVNMEEGRRKYRELNNQLRRITDRQENSGGMVSVKNWKNLIGKEGWIYYIRKCRS